MCSVQGTVGISHDVKKTKVVVRTSQPLACLPTDIHAACVNACHINATRGDMPRFRHVAAFAHRSTLIGSWGQQSDP